MPKRRPSEKNVFFIQSHPKDLDKLIFTKNIFRTDFQVNFKDIYIKIIMKLLIKSLALLSFICLWIVSCSRKEVRYTNPNLTVIYLDSLVEKKAYFESTGQKDSVRFVKLETNDNCLIGQIVKITIKNNLIFVNDNNNKLFVFNDEGKFLNQIGSVGQGPGELITLYDFYIDDQYVYIKDMLRRRFTKYTYDGKLQEIIDLDDVLQYYVCFTLLNDGNLLLQSMNGPEMEYNYRIVNPAKKYRIEKECLPFRFIATTWSSPSESQMGSNKNATYALALFSDTIYKYENGNLRPDIVFQGNLKKLRSGQGELIDNISKMHNRLVLDDYSTGLNNLYVTNDYIFFRYFEKATQYYIYWDIEEKKGFYIKNYNDENPLMSEVGLRASTGNALVCYHYPYRLIDKKDKIVKEEHIQFVESLDAEDNPVLAFHYLIK